MSTRLERINEERELLNYEYYHLYNMVKHGSKNSLFPRRTLIQKKTNSTDQAEYGVFVTINGNKKLWKLSSLERCLQEKDRHPGSQIVRLGRDSRSRTFDLVNVADATDQPDPRFLAHADESGNIETPESDVDVAQTTYQLVSKDLSHMGFISQSGCRPAARLLRDIAMRYNNIVPEEFAAAVVRHCELPRIFDGENLPGKSPWKTPEEKEAWFDTPAAKAWVKGNPTPSIFNLPTPEYIHRRG